MKGPCFSLHVCRLLPFKDQARPLRMLSLSMSVPCRKLECQWGSARQIVRKNQPRHASPPPATWHALQDQHFLGLH